VLFGRDAERSAIQVLVDGARASHGGALVLRGEAGAGKSALLDDAREHAQDIQVLFARGVESESELAFAGLHQLLRPVLHLVETLPAPQAEALTGALGLAERPAHDRFLISLSCLTLLSAAAEERAVLCLVDDAQWVDRPSADAFLFAARRLEAEPVAILFTARDPDARPFDGGDLAELGVARIDERAAAEVLGDAVAPAVRDLLIRLAGGNALALVELRAALSAGQLAGTESLPDGIPLTRDVERLFLERVRRLPDDTQRLLAIVASDDTGSLDAVLRAAASVGISVDALAPAEAAGLVAVGGQHIEARHPLVRSAVQQGSTLSERRAAHLALAAVLDAEEESDQRAWHHAAAALGADEEVAGELERTAGRAQLRGGHAAAAAALVRAAELSVDSSRQGRRLVTAARSAWNAGDPARALAILDRAEPFVEDGWVRAEMNHIRGTTEWICGDVAAAAGTLLEAAEQVAPFDARKALEMLFDAGMAARDTGDYARLAEACRQVSALPEFDDPRAAFQVDLLVAVTSITEGRTAKQADLLRAVIDRAQGFDEPRWLVWAAVGAQVAADQAAEASLLRRAATLARARGEVDTLVYALMGKTIGTLLVGRRGATEESAEALALAREAGLTNAVSLILAALAWGSAVRGDEESCRTQAAEASASAQENRSALANSIAEWSVAVLDLAIGRPEEAATRLAAIGAAPPGVGHPFVLMASAADLIEACVRCGRLELADAAQSALERFADPGAPAWARALAARCRAMRATGEAAQEAYHEALALHGGGERPLDWARTELLFGEFLRRERHRVEAREHLRSAVERFERIDAHPWAERARSELRASGETARKRDPSTLLQLTPQELQVARFVAEGLSNKEVAAQLFLSPRTIDAHLRSVFSKLGITSRTQLARLDLAGDAQPAAPVLA
jgi:DNA-binding CsgD family transcriptional regulator